MNELLLPSYDGYRTFIEKEFRRGTNRDRLRFLAVEDDDEASEDLLHVRLPMIARTVSNPDGTPVPRITPEQWIEIYDLKIAELEDLNPVAVGPEMAGQDLTNFTPPEDQGSCWVRYAWKLRNERGFSDEAVTRLKDSCVSSIRHMCLTTENREPPHSAVKGLVVGSIQSGKTSHMAGLISMAADAGFNFFVVLSGTIENLRVQTQERLVRDLSLVQTPDGFELDALLNYHWTSMPHLDPYAADVNPLGRLNLNRNGTERYISVCLKNAMRLRRLIAYLQSSPQFTARLRILVIDDECDQGSVNGANIEQGERTALYELITALCDHRRFNGLLNNAAIVEGAPYLSINYVAYTGTPYATLLNDGRPESLFPRDFIMPLTPGKAYVGGRMLFGDPEGAGDRGFEGHPFLNKIEDDEVNQITAIQNGNLQEVPPALQDAVRWFLVTVAVQRFRGQHRENHNPVSMLIHTAMRTRDHQQLSNLVNQFVTQMVRCFAPDGNLDERNRILDEIKETYRSQTNQLTLQEFHRLYPDYGENETPDVEDYPDFNDIQPMLVDLLSAGVQNIEVNAEMHFEYSRGIHFCVDNSQNNGIQDVGEDGRGAYIRIRYPDAGIRLGYEPAFLIIGGNTLARGLTLEGLTTTYFSRRVNQIDTLQQMGRFFGYRIGYELLPRIWISDGMRRNFRAATETDLGISEQLMALPANFGLDDLRIFIRRANDAPDNLGITARNRMQNATLLPRLAGQRKEVLRFSNNAEILENNRNCTITFLNGLGVMQRGSDYGQNNYYKRGVQWNVVRGFFERYRKADGTPYANAVLDTYVNRWLHEREWVVVVAGQSSFNDDEHDIVWGENNQYRVGKNRRSATAGNNDENGWTGLKNASSASDFLTDIVVHDDCPAGSPPFTSRLSPMSYRLEHANLRGRAAAPILLITCVEKLDADRHVLPGSFYGFGIGYPALTEEEARHEFEEVFVGNLEG